MFDVVAISTYLTVSSLFWYTGMLPVMAFLINIWYTAKGRLGEIHANIGAKFVFTGTIMYFFCKYSRGYHGIAGCAARDPF